MTGDGVTCMRCGAISVPADRFCESCGGPCSRPSRVRRVAIPGQVQSQEIPCADCGGATYVDDYCAACGNRRAEPDRERGRARRDRARHRPRSANTPATRTPPRPESSPAHRATPSPSRCATGCRARQPPTPRRTPRRPPEWMRCSPRLPLNGNRESAVLAGLADAAKAATAAGADTPDLAIAPSCTYTAVAVVPTAEGRIEIAVGNVGDSRAYWLPDPPAHARCS